MRVKSSQPKISFAAEKQAIRPGQVIKTYRKFLRKQGIDPQFNISNNTKIGEGFSIDISDKKTKKPLVLLIDPLSEWGKVTEERIQGKGNNIKSAILNLFEKSRGWQAKVSEQKGKRFTLPEKINVEC